MTRQTHGFPKVMGVVTHLDALKNNKALNKTKKRLKQRFWTEIYDGAKMFYLSGTINHKYLKHEIRNMTLYISRLKFRPLTWRNTHPYLLVDRFEDVTPPEQLRAQPHVSRERSVSWGCVCGWMCLCLEHVKTTSIQITDSPTNPKPKTKKQKQCERELVLYGYVRGSHLKPGMKVHLIGAGDFDMAAVCFLGDDFCVYVSVSTVFVHFLCNVLLMCMYTPDARATINQPPPHPH
jgi:ribosome biogenesis protein BMS1